MATLTRLLCLALVGCGDLQGYGGAAPPLATFHVDVTGDFELVREDADAPTLRVASGGGKQWLPERFCFETPMDANAAAVLAAGCRDPLGFLPARVAANAPLELGTPTQLELFALPAADVMVGDVTARIAFGSVVVYDDRDGDGTLGLRAPKPLARETMGGDEPDDDSPDRVYGASFVTMSEPDQRIAFREGAFLALSAFYPRSGCGEPPRGFSVLSAGGFSLEEVIAAQLEGRLPQIDSATCATGLPEDAPLTVPLRPPSEVNGASCIAPRTDSTVSYRNPSKVDMADLEGRAVACIPQRDDSGAPLEDVEVVVSSRPDEPCKTISHFILKGCRDGVACEDGGGPDDQWDLTEFPPSWWPCE